MHRPADRFGPLAITLSYIALGVLWILLSDQAMFLAFAGEPDLLAAVGTGKGWAYVGVSGAFMYALVLRRDRAIFRQADVFRSTLASIGDALVVVDRAGRVVAANKAAERLFGALARVDGGGWFEDDGVTPICPADRPLTRALGGQSHTAVVFLRNAQTPEGLWLSVTGCPVLERRGHFQGAVMVCRDVTEARQAEHETRDLATELERRVKERTAELEASARELAAFSSSVSHDLRAPLRTIAGFSRAVLDDRDAELSSVARGRLERVVAASRRMGDIIDSLLELSRVTRSELLRARVDVSALAAGVVDELHAQEPGRRVEVAIAPDVYVYGDPTLLRIVVENLLGNAWKFTAGRAVAHLEILAERRDGETVVGVRDDGAGFDMAWSEKLYRPFERLHTVQEFPGSGIGLATVERIVARHGGRVWAEGRVGEGATFWFALPDGPHAAAEVAIPSHPRS